MDALQAFAKQEWEIEVTHFVVSGASKRGWTTWLTAAADRAVKALAPCVIDTLNMSVQLPYQLKSWGKYSEMNQRLHGTRPRADAGHAGGEAALDDGRSMDASSARQAANHDRQWHQRSVLDAGCAEPVTGTI